MKKISEWLLGLVGLKIIWPPKVDPTIKGPPPRIFTPRIVSRREWEERSESIYSNVIDGNS